ncbi:MAG: beta-N-acetylhexosaminidase [Alphaproteobacteria bacterium 32-64-14]|nr:MAG: beta-N-acetylhexosaminidase [Alphaproteobacteria bacterium 32-64-14]
MAQPSACILSVSGLKLTDGERTLLSETNPWGVILMGRSCESPAQVKALNDSICDATGRNTLIFIDQEGGRVRRLKPPMWPDFPAPGVYGALYSQDREAAYAAVWLHHRLMAAELEPIGIRADCAPVVDIHHEGMHKIVGDRAFGATAEMVADLAQVALDGLGAGGVAGVIKHMPGHGRAEVDSHESMPVVRGGRELVEIDIAPFKAVRHAAMGMTAHLAFPALDDDKTPATLSPKIINEVIRGEIGFGGLLMTDDLGMKALGGSLASRAERALAAGCDVILHCAGLDAWGKVLREPDAVLREMQEVVAVCPPLSGESLRRAEAADAATGHVTPLDAAEGRARLTQLLSGGAGES